MEETVNLFPIAQLAKWHNMAISNYIEKLNSYIETTNNQINKEKIKNYMEQVLKIIEFRK
jgi:hypothetical protein